MELIAITKEYIAELIYPNCQYGDHKFLHRMAKYSFLIRSWTKNVKLT